MMLIAYFSSIRNESIAIQELFSKALKMSRNKDFARNKD